MQIQPIDLVLGIIPQLNPKELQQVHHCLCSTPCERNGHRYKTIAKQVTWFGTKVTVKVVCTTCGISKEI